MHTDSAARGYGYTGTPGHLATDRLIRDCIGEAFAPLLVGEEPCQVGRIWQKLYHAPSIRWVGLSGIVQMALSAIDVALWDIKAKAAEMPLWKYLGGDGQKRLEAYNTDGGWLNWTRKQLVDCARADATRLGGISAWLRAADLAAAYRLPVVAHAGDMMQIHQHVSLAHPACEMLEYIPWLRVCFEEPATVEAGYLKIPQMPGAGTTLRADAIDRFGVGWPLSFGAARSVTYDC